MNKKLIAPIVTAGAMLATSIGSTFALFTSKASSNISINSGYVEISANLADLSIYSASLTDDDETGVVIPGSHDLGEFSADYFYVKQTEKFINGGTAIMDEEGALLTLSNVSPGDKVTLSLNMENSSNINIKYRVSISSENDDLFEALVFNVNGFDYSGIKSIVMPWESWLPEESSQKSLDLISITLPLTAGNEWQGKSTTIKFSVDAVQGNACVEDPTESENFINEINGLLERKHLDFPTLALDELPSEKKESLLAMDNLVWNEKYNLFGINEDGVMNYATAKYPVVFDENVWEFSETYLEDGHPIYLTGDTVGGVLTISSSLDVGNQAPEEVKYQNNDAGKEVVIRTSSYDTILTIDAPNDSVRHFDKASKVNVDAVAMSSYHEFGDVKGNIDLKAGNVVVEDGCKASAIMIDMTAAELATVTTLSADNSQAKYVPIMLNTTEYAWSVNENNDLINPESNNIIYTKAPQEGKETSTDPADMVDYGALVDDVGYPTFKEAIAACGNKQTVRLLKDYKYATSPSYVSTQIDNYAIDFNGHTLDFNDSGYGLNVKKGQTVSLNDSEGNGYLKNRQCVVYMSDGSNLIINGGRVGGVDKDQATIYGYGSLTINGGCIESAYMNGYAYYSVMIGNYSNNNTPAIFNMTGGEVLGSLYLSGNDRDNNIINISGGSIDGGSYIAGNNTTTITGGNFTGTTCFYFKVGTVNISGGNFTSTKGDGDWLHKDSACTNTGDAVIFESCNYPAGELKANVTGGTFKGYKEEGGTEPTSGNIYFKNYGILVINYGGDTCDTSGTTVAYQNAVVESNTAEGFVTENGYIHFTDLNTTTVNP